jgi:hypothetical protein
MKHLLCLAMLAMLGGCMTTDNAGTPVASITDEQAFAKPVRR